MHFFIRETLSFNLIYVAACYLVGTGMCHNMVGLLQHNNVFHRGPLREAIGPIGANCFSSGVRSSIFKETYSHL